MSAPVVVIGAGFAGLSAAVHLADAGRRVVVLESSPRLGGRASTFADPATGERVDNGQHVLFGCYRETYAFLKRLGMDGQAPLDRRLDVTIVGSDGRPHRLSCPSLPSPWHLVAGILKWQAIPFGDRLTARKLAPVFRGRVDEPSPDQTVSTWLLAHGQSPLLCKWLWDPLAVAALNQSPDVAAAAPFVRVLRELFGPGVNDSAIGVPAVPLDELYAIPAARFIEARGGVVLTKSPARVVVDTAGRISAVRAGTTTFETSTVVSAVPWHAFSQIWDAGVPAVLSDLAARAAALGASPIVTVNLWFDRPVMSQRFVGFVDGAMHWAFDKSAIFGGTAGHVSIVSSGAADLAALENSAVVALAMRDLTRALPAVAGSRLLRSIVVREHRATFSLAPGGPARPGITTPLPGVFLAGDWIDTGLPGTIESAVQSGHAAARAVLGEPSG